MLRLFLKDSAIYVIPSLISRGLALFLLPLYTRVLSPADYGSLDLFVVFAGLVNLTVALEVSQGVARFYAAEQDVGRKIVYASSAFWFTLACYAVTTTLLLVFAEPLSSLVMGQPQLTSAFQVGAIYILFNGIFYLVQNQLRWELRSKHYAITSLSMSLLTAVVSAWLGYGLRWGLEGLLIGMAVGCFGGSAVGWWLLRHSFRFRFDATRLREMLAYSTPLVVSGLAAWLGLYIDRLMINHLLSVNDVGLYGIGYRVASLASLAMVGFQGALTPLVYTYYREADTPHQLARIFRLFFFCACVMFLILTLLASDIVRLLTIEPFYGGAATVIYLVPAMLLANMYIFAPGIGIAKKTHLLIWIHIGGALLNIALNYLLVPIMGIEGAGLATLLSYALVFGLYMTFSQQLYQVPHHWKPFMLSATLAGVLAWGVPQLGLADNSRWALSALALFGFSLTAVLLGVVHTNELRQVAALIKATIRPNSPGASS